MSAQETIDKKAKTRKLLALDGGGIRGMITIEILAGIEDLLRRECRKPKLVLADHFDYIAGTSTGAIIATCLSLGMPVDELRDFYVQCGPQMFVKSALLDRVKSWYLSEPLAEKLKDTIGMRTGNRLANLDDPGIRTLLMMVLRNATTDSPWPLSNNPWARYNSTARPDCNLKLPLWQLVRASTAAPTYFPPEVVEIGPKSFVFVDGGMTSYNNPAFQLFLMATAEPYCLKWPASKEKMLLVSIGTGTAAAGTDRTEPGEFNLLYNAMSIPGALMNAASQEQDFLCRVFGHCLMGGEIDREVGTLLPGDPRGIAGPIAKLFTYVRYDAELTRGGLDELGLTSLSPDDLKKLDSIAHINDLSRVGQAVAKYKVKREHFAGFID
jgi:hypothetical protein